MRSLGAYEEVERSVHWLRGRFKGRHPAVALVLTSGIGGFTKGLEDPITFTYQEIPGFPRDHEDGRLWLGKVNGVEVMVMDGRYYFYDGYAPHECVHGVRVMGRLGAQALIIKNAAGSADPKVQPGSLVVVTGHLNLTGDSPLRGPHDERLGPQHVDMTKAYDSVLRDHIHDCAARLRADMVPAPTPEKPDAKVTTWPMPLHPGGVFAQVPGPEFETEHQVTAIREQGGTLIGMAMAFEVIAARQLDMRCAGIVQVTNMAAGVEGGRPTPTEIRTSLATASPLTVRLLREVMGTPMPPQKVAVALD